MLSESFSEYMDRINEQRNYGTFVGIKWNPEDVENLLDLYRDEVENLNTTEIHTTLVHSAVNIDDQFEFADDAKGQIATATGLERLGPNGECLVVLLKCKWLQDRHRFIHDTTNAEYTWDDYIPHITLSYDFDPDIQLSDLYDPEGLKIRIKKEYVEKLD